MSGGFTQVPNSVLRGEHYTSRGPLSLQARVLYALILDFSNGKLGACIASQTNLARMLGLTTRTVYTLTQELKEAELIVVRREGRGVTNTIFALVRPNQKLASGHPQKLASAEQHLQGSNTEKDNESGRDRDNALEERA